MFVVLAFGNRWILMLEFKMHDSLLLQGDNPELLNAELGTPNLFNFAAWKSILRNT